MFQKIVATALLVFACTFNTYSQESAFTGKIIYEYQFLDPSTGRDITAMLKEYFGEEQHYFINAENYKSLDEEGGLKQLYNSDTNQYYALNPTTGAIEATDAGVSTSTMVEIIHHDETITILGREFKKVTVATEDDKTVYYYDPSLRVDPKPFSKHKFGNWDAYLNATNGAIALRYDIVASQFIMIVKATSIEKMTLENAEFDVSDFQ